MANLGNAYEYENLAARMDIFISEMLEHGTFAPSVIGTELIYQAINICFSDEPDAFATFSDRLAAHRIRVVEDPHTGADLLVGLRLKTKHVPLLHPRVDAFRTSLAND